MLLYRRVRCAFVVAALLAPPASSIHAAEDPEEPKAAEQAEQAEQAEEEPPVTPPREEPQAPPHDEPPAKLTQEWVGIEVVPLAMALPDNPVGRDGHVSSLQAGPGGNLRFGRHRWEYVYAIPFEAGLFVSTAGTQTIFLHLQTEIGVVVPGTDRRLELGAGGGVGILAMQYGTGCDGSCNLGGSGWLLSLAARVLLVDGPSRTVGVNVRAVFPQGRTPGGEVFGYYVGGGDMVFAGVEIGFGRP
jgi:hypothetical protein